MKFIICALFLDAGMGTLIPYLNLYANFSIIDIFIIAAIIINSLCRNKKIIINKSIIYISIIYFGFVIFQLLSTLVSPYSSVESLGPIVRNLYYCFLIINLIPEFDDISVFKKVIVFFVLGVLINMTNNLYLWSLNKRYINGIVYLNNGIINRNMVYYYGVFAMPFLFYLIENSRKVFNKIIYVILVLLNSVICMITFSKGAWLILAITYFMYLINNTRENIYKKLPVAFIILLIVVIAINSGLIDTLRKSKFENYDIEDDERIKYKVFALETGLKYPLGVGPKSYKEYTEKYAPHSSTTDPHDTALMIMTESGILSLFIYFILQYIYIKEIYVSRKYENILKIKNTESNFLINLYIVYLVLSIMTGMIFTSKMSIVLGFLICGYSNIMKKIAKNSNRM